MRISLIALTFLLASCSSTKIIEAPSASRVSELVKTQPSYEDLDTNERLALKFKNSKLGSVKSCLGLVEISKEKNFPLSSVALVKALEICDFPAGKLTELWSSDNKIPKWLNRRFLEISTKKAMQYNLTDYVVKFSVELSKFSNLQKEKEKLLKKALKIAKNNEDLSAIRKIETRLFIISPRLNKNYPKSERYRVARDFERNRNFKRARRLYHAEIQDRKTTLDDKVRAWNRLRLSYKIERDKKTYVTETKNLRNYLYRKYRKDKSSKNKYNHFVKTSITYSRAQWTEHRRDIAQKELYNLIRKVNLETSDLAQVYWLLGSMWLEAKEYKRSIRYFNMARKLQPNNERYVWSLAWNNYKKGNYKEAESIFRDYNKDKKDEKKSSRFLYWQAKSLSKLKLPDEAEDVFEELIDNFDFNYYSFLSHFELGIEIEGNDDHEEISPIKDDTFEWLFSVGEFEIARDYLDTKRREWKTPELRKASLPLYKRVGYYNAMISQVYSLPPAEREELIKENPTFAFPKPFKKEVQKAAERFKVAPELIYAISRQESAFNKNARSWADAFGVMQIIPEKAKILGHRYEIPYRDHNDLYKPQTNVQLGASLLNELQRMFKGQFPLYVASYNASDKAVRKWYQERYNGDFVEFIEMIPYAETRKYVKLVMRNYFIYKRIYNDDDFGFSDQFFYSGELGQN